MSDKIDSIVHEIDNLEALDTVYTKWSNHYDEDVTAENGYRGYLIMAKTVDLFCFRNKTRRILDVGAGTGLVAIEMKKQGYNNIDALEPNEAMVKISKERDLYKNYFRELIMPDRDLETIPEGTYDHVTAAGCFSKGHMNYRHIVPMLKIVKKGGHLSFSFRGVYLNSHQKELPAELDRIVCEGLVVAVVRGDIPDYYTGVSGYLVVLQKL